MKKPFNSEEAKKSLIAKEEKEKEKRENDRKVVLQQVTELLRKEFEVSATEVYLIGSVLQPFSFSQQSDIDIVLKNYSGDRFEIWTKLEKETGRKVEIILFETCHFQDFVIKNGFKVI